MALFGNNWQDQVKRLLPPSHRSGTIIGYITSLIQSVQRADDSMVATEDDLRFRVQLTSQKMVLQAALVEIFGVAIIVQTNTSVAVGNFSFNESEGFAPLYCFNESESAPTVYIFNESEVVDPYDFTVKIPNTDYANLVERVRAEVTGIKLGGKTFNVVSYIP